MNSLALVDLNFRSQYRDRWYSPEQGQFLSEDPIGFESKDSNFYRYVFNNPMLFTDPDGLDVFKCKRPLEGMPFMIGALNHTFLCVNKYCNGQTSSTGSSSPNPGTPSNDPTPQSPPPGSPNGTTPGGGGVACTKVKPPKNKKKCFEKCTLKKLQTPIRPVYGIPFGTDCQEFAEETVESCFERCSNE